MIDPLSGWNHGARGLFGPGSGATITLAPIALTALVHRLALDRADRADAVGHLSAPARRSIWARISSI